MPKTNNKAPRVKMGKEVEKNVKGVKRLVRRGAERFKGKIKGVDMEDMHEDFYDVDVLKKS